MVLIKEFRILMPFKMDEYRRGTLSQELFHSAFTFMIVETPNLPIFVLPKMRWNGRSLHTDFCVFSN